MDVSSCSLRTRFVCLTASLVLCASANLVERSVVSFSFSSEVVCARAATCTISVCYLVQDPFEFIGLQRFPPGVRSLRCLSHLLLLFCVWLVLCYLGLDVAW